MTATGPSTADQSAYDEGRARGWYEALRALRDHHAAIADSSEGVTTRSVHMVIADAATQFAADKRRPGVVDV